MNGYQFQISSFDIGIQFDNTQYMLFRKKCNLVNEGCHIFFYFIKGAKFMPLTDPPVYNSCNLLIFLNIIKNTNEAGKKFIAIFHKNYVSYYIKLCKLLHKIM